MILQFGLKVLVESTNIANTTSFHYNNILAVRPTTHYLEATWREKNLILQPNLQNSNPSSSYAAVEEAQEFIPSLQKQNGPLF